MVSVVDTPSAMMNNRQYPPQYTPGYGQLAFVPHVNQDYQQTAGSVNTKAGHVMYNMPTDTPVTRYTQQGGGQADRVNSSLNERRSRLKSRRESSDAASRYACGRGR